MPNCFWFKSTGITIVFGACKMRRLNQALFAVIPRLALIREVRNQNTRGNISKRERERGREIEGLDWASKSQHCIISVVRLLLFWDTLHIAIRNPIVQQPKHKKEVKIPSSLWNEHTHYSYLKELQPRSELGWVLRFSYQEYYLIELEI